MQLVYHVSEVIAHAMRADQSQPRKASAPWTMMLGTIARGGATCPANECGSESGVNWLADAVEARVAQGSEGVERLRHALLAKAFRGELVPLEPNHEAASAMI